MSCESAPADGIDVKLGPHKAVTDGVDKRENYRLHRRVDVEIRKLKRRCKYSACFFFTKSEMHSEYFGEIMEMDEEVKKSPSLRIYLGETRKQLSFVGDGEFL